MTTPATGKGCVATRHPLFAAGFRPFFLLVGLSGPVLVTVWLAILAGVVPAGGAVAPVAWHSHEMLFGFVAAAVAGFLLTAVPNWTGAAPLSGRPLMGLTVLWLAGRVASLPDLAGNPVAAAVDVAFFPALGAALAASLMTPGAKRNRMFLVLLGLLTVASLLVRLDWLGVLPGAEGRGLALAIGVVLVMITVIGGRIVPAFTRNALRAGGDPTADVRTIAALEILAPAVTVAMVVADVALPGSALAGALALAACVAHGVRLSGWRSLRTLRQPIVWVLHLGYGWLVVALGLKAAWQLAGLPVGMAWLHALTVGAFATMILGVMSRAALGHAGRPLVTPAATVAGYGLLSLAAVARIAAPLLPGDAWGMTLAGAGVLWTLAFVLFLRDYAPVLLRARSDGRPG
jgi:uncharacterized protein involved in response to NO